MPNQLSTVNVNFYLIVCCYAVSVINLFVSASWPPFSPFAVLACFLLYSVSLYFVSLNPLFVWVISVQSLRARHALSPDAPLS